MRTGKIWTVLIYVVSFTIFFSVERAEDLLDQLPFEVPWRDSVLNVSAHYQRLVTFQARVLEAKRVTLVPLNEASLPRGTLANACYLRQFLQKLILRVNALEPRVIALDFAFTYGSCDDPDINKRLVDAVREVAKQRPVVLGLWSETAEELLRAKKLSDEKAAELGLRKLDLVLIEHEEFSSAPKTLSFGLTRANADIRKIPIEWPVRLCKGPDIAHSPVYRESFAYKVALVDRSGLEDSSLEHQRFKHQHPFTSFLPPSRFVFLNPSQILGDIAKPDMRVLGKIVLIGRSDDVRDMWKTPVGDMPGYEIQANYIEALLDGRLLGSFPGWAQVLLNFLWFFIIEMPFHMERFSTRTAIAISLTAVLTGVLLVWLLAVIAYFYLVPWVPSAVAVMLRVHQKFFETPPHPAVQKVYNTV